ncbi:taste receptor type 2 member 9-like [Neopelma chrysocephalum]|uniref:taste receptor type 2 member 9-like n=1 Tax=Neopelma chrysocephalum TaxID=114329 RepID=UPI000FCD13DB|nr:taste receptor type 2 member 9-like [Neopelma chrysocephalum]
MEACHSPEQSNVTSYGATTVAIITLETFAGMWINAFMFSVICVTWVKKKTLNSNEKILLALGCSRFWFLCIAWVFSIFLIIYLNYLYVHPIFQLLESAHSFFNFSNLWFSASLCVFYCIKIANFRNNFFIYLKVKIDSIVPWLMLGSVLFSLVIGTTVYNIMDKALSNNLNFTSQGRISKASIRIDQHFLLYYFIIGFGFVTSFTAVILSALLLLFSLWRHKHNMQTNSMKDLSMDAHIKAMKSILSFFIMYSINFICLILTLIYTMKNESDVIFLIYLIQYTFPGLHSLVLIFSNPNLEKRLRGILPCVKRKVFLKREL